MKRLEDEWNAGANQFDKANELLFCVYNNKKMIGIGGLNICPFSNSNNIGRLRRFYISKMYRRNGIGKLLLNTIITNSSFRSMTLYTDNPIAAVFYERSGFAKVEGIEKVSHIRRY